MKKTPHEPHTLQHTVPQEAQGELPVPGLIAVTHLKDSLKKSFLQDVGLTKESVDDPSLYAALRHKDLVEELLIDSVEAAARAFGVTFPKNAALDLSDPATREAVHAVLRAPYDCLEICRNDQVQEVLSTVRSELFAEEAQALTPRQNHLLAEEVLWAVALFHEMEMKQLLSSVTEGKARTQYDDPLHDLAAASHVRDAIRSLTQRYPQSSAALEEAPLNKLLTHAEHAGMIHPSRQRHDPLTMHDNWVAASEHPRTVTSGKYLN